MLYALIILIILYAVTVVALTYLHQNEKRDLHNRLMAKSPDEYIYDTQVAPLEVEALKQEFTPKERTNDTPEEAKLKQQIQKQGF